MTNLFSTKNFHRHSHAGLASGFTLVETLIAISILTIAILGPMSIAQSGLQAARYAESTATAQFLAKEGVEHVKSRIYSNMSTGKAVLGNEWLKFGIGGSTACMNGGQSCVIDARPGSEDIQVKTQCEGDASSSQCPYLYQDANGFYGQDSSGTITPYKRWFTVDDDIDGQATIYVQVYWVTSDGRSHTFNITDSVFYWYNKP